MSIDKRWDNFSLFVKDMGLRPEGTTLDRKDPNGNYEPSNCQWADPVTQAKNRRITEFHEYNGERLTTREISERTGVPAHTIIKRIKRFGWSAEKAVNPPEINRRGKAIRRNPTKKAVLKSKGVTNPDAILNRVKKGATEAEAIKAHLEEKKRQDTTVVTVGSDTKTIGEWAKKLGTKREVLWQRIHRDGMTPVEAVTKPLNRGGGNLTKWKGKFRSEKEIAEMEGIARTTLKRRLSKGMEMKAAVASAKKATKPQKK